MAGHLLLQLINKLVTQTDSYTGCMHKTNRTLLSELDNIFNDFPRKSNYIHVDRIPVRKRIDMKHQQ